MKVIQIQFTPWDRVYNFDALDFDIKVSDQVVAKTEVGTDIGKVVTVFNDYKPKEGLPEIKPILRKVTTEDLFRSAQFERGKDEAIEYCKQATEKYNLEMKIVDVHYSLDGGRLTFAFIADGRVDFRQLVKDLTHHFQKSIRLHQLGIRDEAKMTGDVGPCGRGLCCKRHLKELVSITSEMADLQQIAHRGSDRLSGMCGRLRCCLDFEREEYERLAAGLPQVGTKVKTKQGRGEVIGLHILKQSVDVRLEEDKSIVEIPVTRQ